MNNSVNIFFNIGKVLLTYLGVPTLHVLKKLLPIKKIVRLND